MVKNRSIIKLPQLTRQGQDFLELEMPSGWQIEISNMTGDERRELHPDKIREAIRNPVNGLPIHLMTGKQQQTVIIFDDTTRATRVAQIAPLVLEGLAEAGVSESQIRFIGATGCHGPMNRSDFVKKLGEDIVRRFPVYNHNPFNNCIRVGTTDAGTEIGANSEVMSCGLKIAIGSMVPHLATGFSGGSKIILPGICSIETNTAFHKFETECRKNSSSKQQQTNNAEDNLPRRYLDQAMEMVGLDFLINTIINSCGETVALYAGTPRSVFQKAVTDARSHYLSRLIEDADIVVANCCAKASEPEAGLSLALASLGKKTGDIVLICTAPEGHVPHYLFGPWGKTAHDRQTQIPLPDKVKHLYVLNAFPDITFINYFKNPEKVSILPDWNDIIKILDHSHGPATRVAVYPAADIQYYQAG